MLIYQNIYTSLILPLLKENKKPIVLIQSAIFDLQIAPFRLAQFRDESLVKSRQVIIFFYISARLCKPLRFRRRVLR